MTNYKNTNYKNYLQMSWTKDSDLCEAGCGVKLSEESYVEGE